MKESAACTGRQKCYEIWSTIPRILIFDHESMVAQKGKLSTNLLDLLRRN